jgi:hypothetical protein
MQGSDFPNGGNQTVTTTLYFTQPQVIQLYFFADYNDSAIPPDYDVLESDPDNNVTVRTLILLDPDAAEQTETAFYWGTETARPPISIHQAFLPQIFDHYGVWYAYLPIVFRTIPPTPTLTPTPPTPSPMTETPTPSQIPTPSPVTPTSSPSPSPTPIYGNLHIVFATAYPCKQAGPDAPIRAKAYVTDDGGQPVSDALVTVSIGSDSWQMGPITGSPGAYGDLGGLSCWNSATASPPRTYNSDWNVTISAAKAGYGGSSATRNTSAQDPCSDCP